MVLVPAGSDVAHAGDPGSEGETLQTAPPREPGCGRRRLAELVANWHLGSVSKHGRQGQSHDRLLTGLQVPPRRGLGQATDHSWSALLCPQLHLHASGFLFHTHRPQAMVPPACLVPSLGNALHMWLLRGSADAQAWGRRVCEGAGGLGDFGFLKTMANVQDMIQGSPSSLPCPSCCGYRVAVRLSLPWTNLLASRLQIERTGNDF